MYPSLGEQRVEQILPYPKIRGDEPGKCSRQIEQAAARGALEQTERADRRETMRPRRGNTSPVVNQENVGRHR